MIIACLGDSLTEGDYGVAGKRGIANVQKENYPYFLARETGASVRNYGRCGFTATTYLAYYETGAVVVRDADVIILMLGTNGGLDPACDTPGNEDYRTLIRHIRKDAPDAFFALCTPPHATENPAYSNCGCAPRVKKAGLFVRTLAKSEGLPLIDVASCPAFTAQSEAVMQPNDGLHFGREGYRALASYIWEETKKLRETP